MESFNTLTAGIQLPSPGIMIMSSCVAFPVRSLPKTAGPVTVVPAMQATASRPLLRGPVRHSFAGLV